jgi:hypothetical protein
MANHVRRQIREAVAALLTGLTTTGANVFQSRLQPLPDNKLPALKIITDAEQLEPLDISGNFVNRSLTVGVIAVAKAVSDVDDVIDEIIKEVEIKLATDRTLSGLVKDIVLVSIDIDMSGETEKNTGQAIMNFTANYFTTVAAPDVSI